MKILILGGTSFIGPQVVRKLTQQGHQITLFHRGKTLANLPPGVSTIRGNRQELGNQIEALRAEKPDVVVDMICFTQEDAADLVQVFAGHARRAVVLSSADVYRQFGGLIRTEEPAPDNRPLTEVSPLRLKRYPFRLQAKHASDFNHSYEKIDVENTLLGSQLPTCLLRLPMVYGEGDKQRRLSPYLEQLKAGAASIKLAELHSEQRVTRGYVENMAHAVALAITSDASAGKTYNVADDVTLAEADFVRALIGSAGFNAKVEAVPADEVSAENRYPGDAHYHLAIDSGAIRRELGHRDVVPFAEGLARTAKWELATL